MCIVKYIGPCHLGDGVWLGVEASTARADGHDGSIEGRRYFTCKSGRGILIRASKVTWHGHNVGRLLDSSAKK